MINNATRPDAPRRELWLLLTLAGIQFTHILDFMIMMPLGSQFTVGLRADQLPYVYLFGGVATLITSLLAIWLVGRLNLRNAAQKPRIEAN